MHLLPEHCLNSITCPILERMTTVPPQSWQDKNTVLTHCDRAQSTILICYFNRDQSTFTNLRIDIKSTVKGFGSLLHSN